MTSVIRMNTMKVRQTIRTSLKVKPFDKIQQTKPQESRARKLDWNGIALTIARIVSKFKTRTIVYSTLRKSVAKIGHSTHIYKHISRSTCIIGAKIKKNSVQERAFHSGFLYNEKIYSFAKQNFNSTLWQRQENRLLTKSFFWTCFPPISIDKNGQKDIFNIKGVLYCCFNAMKLPFSWRI